MSERPKHEEADHIHRLKERFLAFQEPEHGAELQRKVEATAITWREATEVMYSPEPYYLERQHGGRWARDGETLRDPTNHGSDAAGNVVIIRNYYTHVYLRDEGLIEEIRLRSDGCAHAVIHYYMEGGRVARQYDVFVWHFQKTDYTWEAGRLVRSVADIYRDDSWFLEDDPLSVPVVWSTYVQRAYEYAPDGVLERIVLTGLSDPFEVEYQRPRRKETVTSVSRVIEELLLQRIPDVLKSASTIDPLYCVFIVYCSSGWTLRPTLCLAKEADRKQFDLGEGEFDTERMWFPSELPDATWLDLDDPTLAERWNLFYQLMGTAEDFEHCPRMLQRVALRLNGMDWNGIFRHTDDFVFTASDTENEIDYRDDLKNSIPLALQALLQKRGLWP